MHETISKFYDPFALGFFVSVNTSVPILRVECAIAKRLEAGEKSTQFRMLRLSWPCVRVCVCVYFCR